LKLLELVIVYNYLLLIKFDRRFFIMVKEYDIVVCGGGPAGFTAAIQAARSGKKTAIVERFGMLGGAMTVGGNPEVALFFAWGRQVIAGIGWELMERLAKLNWAKLPDPLASVSHDKMAVSVNIPMAAYMMDQMCMEDKVDIYLHQPVVDVLHYNDSETSMKVLNAVRISTKTGLETISGKVFIDCTGDGDIAAWAGASYELGDELQPGTLRFYLTGYRYDDIDEKQINDAYLKAIEEGQLKHHDFWAYPGWKPSYILKNKGDNVNHVLYINGADSNSRTKGEIEGRKSVARIVNWLRSEVRGAENVEAIAIAPETCIRESRRILGDDYITGEDYVNGKAYENAVCYSFYPIDIHTCEKDNYRITYLQKGIVPQIPLGALIPKGLKNVLVAGRCISGDRHAQSAFRVKSTCMATGQAAGAAASLAIDNCNDIRKVNVEKLKITLRENGAIVPTSSQ
jgi:hypothetical protein